MIAGLVLLVFFISVPLGFKLSNRTKAYYSYFEGERSLSGLEEGADVKYRGVRIGKISRISYNPADLSRMKVEFRIRHDFPMKEDMYVETGFLGITGLRYAEVLGGSNDAALLKPGSELPSKPSLMASITGKADVIVEKIEILLNHINTFTDPDSLASVKKILDNVASISSEAEMLVRLSRPDILQVTESARSTMEKVDLVASDVRGIAATINQSINPEQLTQLLATVDTTARTLKQLSENLDFTIRQTREDFTASMENLRETLENANELSKILAENPSLLLRGEAQKERRAE
jgi:phospholipid/cholesterol/gamma-HCH transport system substrate-binding protein